MLFLGKSVVKMAMFWRVKRETSASTNFKEEPENKAEPSDKADPTMISASLEHDQVSIECFFLDYVYFLLYFRYAENEMCSEEFAVAVVCCKPRYDHFRSTFE